MKVWIARDSTGDLFMYSEKPNKKPGFFMKATSNCTTGIWPLPEGALPEVTWENSPKEYMITMNIYELKAQIKKGGVN